MDEHMRVALAGRWAHAAEGSRAMGWAAPGNLAANVAQGSRLAGMSSTYTAKAVAAVWQTRPPFGPSGRHGHHAGTQL